VDLTGPSIPRMFGLDRPEFAVHQSTAGWVPVYADAGSGEQRLPVMSVGFLLKKKGDSVVWRGPKKNAMIRQFLSDVRWGELDYLVIDTPPGKFHFHNNPNQSICLSLLRVIVASGLTNENIYIIKNTQVHRMSIYR